MIAVLFGTGIVGVGLIILYSLIEKTGDATAGLENVPRVSRLYISIFYDSSGSVLTLIAAILAGGITLFLQTGNGGNSGLLVMRFQARFVNGMSILYNSLSSIFGVSLLAASVIQLWDQYRIIPTGSISVAAGILWVLGSVFASSTNILRYTDSELIESTRQYLKRVAVGKRLVPQIDHPKGHIRGDIAAISFPMVAGVVIVGLSWIAFSSTTSTYVLPWSLLVVNAVIEFLFMLIVWILILQTRDYMFLAVTNDGRAAKLSKRGGVLMTIALSFIFLFVILIPVAFMGSLSICLVFAFYQLLGVAPIVIRIFASRSVYSRLWLSVRNRLEKLEESLARDLDISASAQNSANPFYKYDDN